MKYLNKVKTTILLGYLLAPVVVFGAISDLQGLIREIKEILRSLVPLLMSLGVVIFLYGVVKFLVKADDSGAREEGRRFMMWGIVAIFVMVSIWALVGVLQGTLFGSGGSSSSDGGSIDTSKWGDWGGV